jgi:hypothetical protein
MKPMFSIVLTACVALGALCWTSERSSAEVRGVGGAHFGGGNFGGAHFSGGHFGGARFGGNHFGARNFGGPAYGARITGSHVDGTASGVPFAGGNRFVAGPRLGGRNDFNRNAFGDQDGWHRWGERGIFGEHRWGYGGWGGWGWDDGWAGPVFWPFMFGDVFSSALWPDAYGYDPFWSYGADFDDENGGYPPGNSDTVSFSQNANSPAPPPAMVAQSCGGFAPGVTDFPIERIRKAVRPTREQTAALYDLAAAVSRANTIVDRSCPSESPLTVLSRFDAMENRLDATIKAISIVRPAVAAFYDSLTDEQRQHLNALSAKENHGKRSAAVTETSGNATLAPLCQRQAANFTRPMQHIEHVIQPTEQQQAAINELKQASAEAAEELLASCPQQIAGSPVARLDAMSKRLEATVRAVQIVRPPLAALYGSLSDEQKARFESGRVPTQAGDRAKVGALQCNLAPAVELIVASRQRLSCTYTPDGSGPIETYFGHLTTVGMALGVNGGGKMTWAVFAPISRHYRGALAGTYVGLSADAAVGVGLGANALVGGSRRSVALQPLSVEANTGADLTAGVSRLRLHWAQ